jgi:3-deoxy-D-manno-octulosonic-acid transferase
MVMRIGAWFSPKIKLGVDGRRNLLSLLEARLPEMVRDRPVAWFHAASLGEFEQGRPVMEEFRKQYPGYFIMLTFFSPSGYEIRKNYGGADYICYLPFDTASNAAAFVKILKPQIVFFIKYEFWFNYLRELRMSNAFIFSFSAIFRPGQVFFKPYGGFYRRLLTYFDHILVQNEESVELLRGVGISGCSLAGDTRFDRVSAIAAQVRDLPVIADFINGTYCLIAGSVWEADMQELIPAVNAMEQPLKVIVAPHEIKADEIESWRRKISGSSVLYSEYKPDAGKNSHEWLFIDNIGMLSSLYRYGDVAYIGGGFGSGLHNILEAATFGMPVLFGNKKYEKFQEAKDLISEGGAVAVTGAREITDLLSEWQSNTAVRVQKGIVCKEYVAKRTGATERVMEEVKKVLGE